MGRNGFQECVRYVDRSNRPYFYLCGRHGPVTRLHLVTNRRTCESSSLRKFLIIRNVIDFDSLYIDRNEQKGGNMSTSNFHPTFFFFQRYSGGNFDQLGRRKFFLWERDFWINDVAFAIWTFHKCGWNGEVFKRDQDAHNELFSAEQLDCVERETRASSATGSLRKPKA